VILVHLWCDHCQASYFREIAPTSTTMPNHYLMPTHCSRCSQYYVRVISVRTGQLETN
jgi:hypothetical protein